MPTGALILYATCLYKTNPRNLQVPVRILLHRSKGTMTRFFRTVEGYGVSPLGHHVVSIGACRRTKQAQQAAEATETWPK